MGYYDFAQICLNGHVTNSSSLTSPEFNQKHCRKCGAETTNKCDRCDNRIRGRYHVEGILGTGFYQAPAFCVECGAPFPWTESRLEATRELVDELGLDIPETELLNETINQLVRDTPKAQAAAAKFQRLTENAKPVVIEGLKQILWNVLSESVRKMIWPQ